jgi:hypothetical protein
VALEFYHFPLRSHEFACLLQSAPNALSAKAGLLRCTTHSTRSQTHWAKSRGERLQPRLV